MRRVAGLGARADASLAALHEVLDMAQGNTPVDALATLAQRADMPAMQELASDTGLPLIAIAPEAIAELVTPTQSPRILASFATGCVAEAVALAALGTDAQITTPRQTSRDGTATAAIATLPRSHP